MALQIVQPGYGNATCRYLAQVKDLPEVSFEEIACQLELALGLSLGEEEEEPVCEDGTKEQEKKTRSKTITEEEWEELLKQLDVVEEVLQSMLEQEQKEEGQDGLEEPKKKVESAGEADKSGFSEEAMIALTEESTWSTYKSEEDEKAEINFLTWYTKKEIRCRKIGGRKKDEWNIHLFSTEEYEKVILFIRRFPEDRNLVFAASQEFWLDFLDNDFEADGFVAYFEGKQKNTADTSLDLGNSEYLQTNAGRWAAYINPLGSGSAKRKYLHRICLTCEVECDRKRRLS